jgi:secondary thiamine-phosphate synthase enzyme
MVKQEIISLSTKNRCQWVDISSDVQKIIDNCGIKNGICSVVSLHTTAAITVNENADPDVESDFFKKLAQLIPQREPFYRHAEGNSDSHLKASIVGLSVLVPVAHVRWFWYVAIYLFLRIRWSQKQARLGQYYW